MAAPVIPTASNMRTTSAQLAQTDTTSAPTTGASQSILFAKITSLMEHVLPAIPATRLAQALASSATVKMIPSAKLSMVMEYALVAILAISSVRLKEDAKISILCARPLT